MRYRFNEFEFDSTSLLLTKNGEVLAIRHSQAKVLALLLEKAGTVLNKEDILSQVWQNKIVSEQVVFQNISNLRNLFGNDAIKTFPKLGYQWQLSSEVVSSETQHSASNLNSQNTPTSIPAQRGFFWRFAVLACIFIIAIGIIYSQNEFIQNDTPSVIKLAYVPITDLDAETNAKHKQITLEDNAHFDFTELSHLNTELFENAIETEYPKLSDTYPFILTGKIRSYQQQTYLDFTLIGPFSEWQGLLSGPSKKNIIKQLQQHLKQQVIYELISKPQPPELRKAKLSIAHQASPNDLIILRKLSIIYLTTNEPEKAMAMADKLINIAQSQNNLQQIGRALIYQGKILIRKKLYDLSSNKLKLALDKYEKINDLKHQARTWYYRSWLDDEQNNYPAIKTSLLKSAQLDYDAKNKLGEIEALIYLARRAHDYEKQDDKYHYLQLAENKMKAYQFPDYHFAKISYSYAYFAKALSEKEPHLKQVLKLATLTPEHWFAQSSRRQLVKQYITQNRLVEAQALVDDTTRENYNNSYLKTLMAQATQQIDEMISHAQRTFEQTQLAGNRSLSLEVAMLLVDQNINRDFYLKYIDDNASAN